MQCNKNHSSFSLSLSKKKKKKKNSGRFVIVIYAFNFGQPETIPQSSIDMTKVLEVTAAEDVTGHSNSLAITAPERVTFVKGTCPEETKWWLNILSALPRTKVRALFFQLIWRNSHWCSTCSINWFKIHFQQGRHKRNATFPGGQATTIIQSQSKWSPQLTSYIYYDWRILESNMNGKEK